jgi:hypothetical protein
MALEQERDRWISRRNLAGGIALAGMVVVNVSVMFASIGLAAVASLGFVGSLFFGGYCIVRSRMVDRQLRAARSPRALPEARLL